MNTNSSVARFTNLTNPTQWLIQYRNEDGRCVTLPTSFQTLHTVDVERPIVRGFTCLKLNETTLLWVNLRKGVVKPVPMSGAKISGEPALFEAGQNYVALNLSERVLIYHPNDHFYLCAPFKESEQWRCHKIGVLFEQTLFIVWVDNKVGVSFFPEQVETKLPLLPRQADMIDFDVGADKSGCALFALLQDGSIAYSAARSRASGCGKLIPPFKISHRQEGHLTLCHPLSLGRLAYSIGCRVVLIVFAWRSSGSGKPEIEASFVGHTLRETVNDLFWNGSSLIARIASRTYHIPDLSAEEAYEVVFNS